VAGIALAIAAAADTRAAAKKRAARRIRRAARRRPTARPGLSRCAATGRGDHSDSLSPVVIHELGADGSVPASIVIELAAPIAAREAIGSRRPRVS